MIVDQGVSSLTNLMASMLVARSVTEQLFGAFSFGILIYIIVVNLTRALVSQPLAIRVSARSHQVDEVAAAAGAALVWGAMAGVVVLAAGVAIDGAVGSVLVVVGLLLPALALQDTWRFALFTMGRPLAAVVNDLTWATGLVVLLVAVLSVTDSSVALIVAAWAGAGAVAALLGLWQTGVAPAVGQAQAYVRRHLALGWRFSAEVVVNNGSSHLTMLAVGLITGASGVAAIRGGVMLFGPFTVTVMGLASGGIAEGSRLLARAPHRVVPVLAAISGVLLGIALGWGAVLLMLPSDWGRAVLGDTWPAARQLVVPFTVGTASVAVASGALVGLRVLAAASATLRLGLVTSSAAVVAGVAGAILYGAAGGMYGLAVGGWVNAAGGWWLLMRLQRNDPHRFARPGGMAKAPRRAISAADAAVALGVLD